MCRPQALMQLIRACCVVLSVAQRTRVLGLVQAEGVCVAVVRGRASQVLRRSAIACTVLSIAAVAIRDPAPHSLCWVAAHHGHATATMVRTGSETRQAVRHRSRAGFGRGQAQRCRAVKPVMKQSYGKVLRRPAGGCFRVMCVRNVGISLISRNEMAVCGCPYVWKIRLLWWSFVGQ